MKNFIEKLIQLADGLDGLGLHKDADRLDQIIAKAAAGDEFEDYLKLFDEPVGLDVQEEKGPGGEKVIIEEPEVHTPLEEEEAPIGAGSGKNRLDMIKRRHELMKLKKNLKKLVNEEAQEEYEEKMLDEIQEQNNKDELADQEKLDKGMVKCKSCGDVVHPGQMHYPGNDPENGAGHPPEMEPPAEEDFEDEEDMDEAVNEADDDGLIGKLKDVLKGAPQLASQLLQLVKDNPELLEFLAL